jgi:hypothetical protein
VPAKEVARNPEYSSINAGSRAVHHIRSRIVGLGRGCLVHADELMGCAEGSVDEREFATVTDAIEAYETTRWPDGKVTGGEDRVARKVVELGGCGKPSPTTRGTRHYLGPNGAIVGRELRCGVGHAWRTQWPSEECLLQRRWHAGSDNLGFPQRKDLASLHDDRGPHPVCPKCRAAGPNAAAARQSVSRCRAT